MSDRAAARIAWGLTALAAGSAAAGAILHVVVWGDPGSPDNAAQVVFPLLGVLSFAPVGGLIASRQPRNALCWVVVAIGADIGLAILLDAVAVAQLAGGPSAAGAGAAWSSSFLWYLALAVLFPHLFLLFPTGRPPASRWFVVTALSGVLVLAVLVVALRPGPLPDYADYENPLGVGALAGAADLAERIAWPVVLALLGSSALSLVVRFRRSRGIERLQMKWVTFAVALVAAAWIVGAVPGQPDWLSTLVELVAIVGLCAVPVTIGIAVLRYRLYDIDRVVNRTLVYGVVTVVLVAAYVGLVLAGQAVFSSFAGGGDLAIAVSTLVVAALFLPVRSRVQRVVDRRFYRRRYDAQRTLEGFGARLREQIDLGTLDHDLTDVVVETMQPAHASLWLRAGASS